MTPMQLLPSHNSLLMFYAYIFFAYAFVCGVYGICVCMSTHVWMHMDACRGQRLTPGIFSSCSPLHLMWQGLLLNPKFNDSASLLATGSQSLSLLLKCQHYRQAAMPNWLFTWVLHRLCSSCLCGMLYPEPFPQPPCYAWFSFLL